MCSGGMISADIIAPRRLQNEQLQRRPELISSPS
jgi:hypothetical protein